MRKIVVISLILFILSGCGKPPDYGTIFKTIDSLEKIKPIKNLEDVSIKLPKLEGQIERNNKKLETIIQFFEHIEGTKDIASLFRAIKRVNNITLNYYLDLEETLNTNLTQEAKRGKIEKIEKEYKNSLQEENEIIKKEKGRYEKFRREIESKGRT